MNPSEITWKVGSGASAQLRGVREQFGADYAEQKKALKELLCGYFDQGDCVSRLGKTISPVECHIPGRKGLKVRWLLPGAGKSGGLRLAILLDCRNKMVIIAGAWDRKSNPEDCDFDAAFAEAET